MLFACVAGGCGNPTSCPRVIYLDGAGWYSGDGPIREGLRRAGFRGAVERFGWQSLFGALHDHLTANRHHPRAAALAARIRRLRNANPDGRIVVVGLSAGTGLVVAALEALPGAVQVDSVVLLSPSVSGWHDLSEALRHVRHRLYATRSPHDGLLASARSAGGERGPPAGRTGFRLPLDARGEKEELYRKLVTLPWRPGYAAYGWNGGHVSVTSVEFIRTVIAPRILEDEPHPLDQPVTLARGADR